MLARPQQADERSGGLVVPVVEVVRAAHVVLDSLDPRERGSPVGRGVL